MHLVEVKVVSSCEKNIARESNPAAKNRFVRCSAPLLIEPQVADSMKDIDVQSDGGSLAFCSGYVEELEETQEV